MAFSASTKFDAKIILAYDYIRRDVEHSIFSSSGSPTQQSGCDDFDFEKLKSRLGNYLNEKNPSLNIDKVFDGLQKYLDTNYKFDGLFESLSRILGFHEKNSKYYAISKELKDKCWNDNQY